MKLQLKSFLSKMEAFIARAEGLQRQGSWQRTADALFHSASLRVFETARFGIRVVFKVSGVDLSCRARKFRHERPGDPTLGRLASTDPAGQVIRLASLPRAMPYIVLGLFGLYTVEFGVVGILPAIITRFGITVQQAGMLVGVFALVVAACGPFLVLVSSRYDRKTVLVSALCGFALCSLLSAYAPSFGALLALRILPALLHPIFFAAAFATVTALYPKDRAAHATSLAMVGLTLGLVLGVPMTSWVAARLSYEASFLFCAVATAIPALALLVMLPPQKRGRPLTFGSQLAILRKPVLWVAIAATVLVFATMFSVYSYAAAYLSRQIGLNGQLVSLMMVVFGVGGVCGNLIAGRLLSRNLVGTVLVYPVVLAAAYGLLAALGSTALVPLSLLVLLWGAAHTSGLVVSQMWLTSVAPEAPQFATSLFVSAANAGVMLGAFTGGAAITAWGMHGVIWCGFIFATLSFIAIALQTVCFAGRNAENDRFA
jgi:DHA1 family inner membrane transport protein